MSFHSKKLKSCKTHINDCITMYLVTLSKSNFQNTRILLNDVIQLKVGKNMISLMKSHQYLNKWISKIPWYTDWKYKCQNSGKIWQNGGYYKDAIFIGRPKYHIRILNTYCTCMMYL